MDVPKIGYKDLKRATLMTLAAGLVPRPANLSTDKLIEVLEARDDVQKEAQQPSVVPTDVGLEPLPTTAAPTAGIGGMTAAEQAIYNERYEQYSYILATEGGPEQLRAYAAGAGIGSRQDPTQYVSALAAKDIRMYREVQVSKAKQDARKVSDKLPEVFLFISNDESTDGVAWIRDRVSGEKFCSCPSLGTGTKEQRKRLPYMDHATIIVTGVNDWMRRRTLEGAQE
jgi:hypothetical protein